MRCGVALLDSWADKSLHLNAQVYPGFRLHKRTYGAIESDVTLRTKPCRHRVHSKCDTKGDFLRKIGASCSTTFKIVIRKGLSGEDRVSCTRGTTSEMSILYRWNIVGVSSNLNLVRWNSVSSTAGCTLHMSGSGDFFGEIQNYILYTCRPWRIHCNVPSTNSNSWHKQPASTSTTYINCW